MKLSKQGAAKLMAWATNDIKGDLKDIEFEQKDFSGAVLLSIREAKIAFAYLLRLPIKGNEKMAEAILIPLRYKIDEALEHGDFE